MKVAAFLGSPRPHGNTDTLAEAVLEGARAAGCSTESHALRALRIHHCTGCGNCGRKNRLVAFNTPEARPLVRGKAAGVVAAWEEKGPEAAAPMIRLFELGFRYLELRPAGDFLVDGAGPKGAVEGMRGILERAREFGAALA